MPDDNVTAILLIAHGSRQPGANDDLHRLAERIAASSKFVVVQPSFLELAQPDITVGGDLCVQRGASRVLMIPYFLSQGTHLTRDLSCARDDLAKRHPGVGFHLAPPLGPDPLLDRLVWERIEQAKSDTLGQ